MKKLLFIPFILLVLVSMAACGSSGMIRLYRTRNPVCPVDSVGNGRYLVLYSSRSGNTEKVPVRLARYFIVIYWKWNP